MHDTVARYGAEEGEDQEGKGKEVKEASSSWICAHMFADIGYCGSQLDMASSHSIYSATGKTNIQPDHKNSIRLDAIIP